MASEKLDEKAIFNVARQINSLDVRLEYLRQVCGTNTDLLARLETLLLAYAEQSSFLESPPAPSLSPTMDLPTIEKAGTVIGPYKLLQQIGEGGMGVVYMAEQSKPIARMVALKIIKPGMDTQQVVARFEAERQALAMMDHPNIAKVLDAGTTDSQRPYFVMELVKGIPITNYCDDHHLTPKQRLELFVQVLHAVQHAHQKGIIHRDIKPSNVLVAEYDQQAVPKVIDFGVAKATSQKLRCPISRAINTNAPCTIWRKPARPTRTTKSPGARAALSIIAWVTPTRRWPLWRAVRNCSRRKCSPCRLKI